jgi:hypothetical protein
MVFRSHIQLWGSAGDLKRFAQRGGHFNQKPKA